MSMSGSHVLQTASPAPTGGGLAKGLGAIGGLLGGVGSMMAGQASARYDAATAEAARALAEEAPKKAAWQITRLRLRKRQVLSSQRFAAAASGIETAGTPTDIMQLTEREFLLDQQNIWREGRIEQMTYEEQAQAYDEAAAASQGSGFMGLAGGLLSFL